LGARGQMKKLYKLDDPTTALEFYSKERNEIAGYEHSETTVQKGYFCTVEELRELVRASVTDVMQYADQGVITYYDPACDEIIDQWLASKNEGK